MTPSCCATWEDLKVNESAANGDAAHRENVEDETDPIYRWRSGSGPIGNKVNNHITAMQNS